MNEQTLGLLLFVAAVVSMLCRRFKVPYTVGLTIAGLLLGFLPKAPDIQLTKSMLFSALLPPLIFEAAFQIRWKELKKDFWIITFIATFGVFSSVLVVTAGLRWGMGWSFASALVVGVLISATDPVAVIAIFKTTAVPSRLKLLIESESLFNDGSAAVLFAIALTVMAGEAISVGDAALRFLLTIVGGVACGGIVAGATLLLCGRAKDHLVEITFTTIAAFSSFLVAERLHTSGVLATMTTGLILGNTESFMDGSERGREAVESFWEYAAFVANSLIFLLVGLRVADRPIGAIWLPTAAVTVFSLIGRAIAVYGSSVFFRRSRLRIENSHQHVMVWGGLRGALALGLALGIPIGTPFREEILDVVFGVVAFSVIVQGLTINPFIKALKLFSEA